MPRASLAAAMTPGATSCLTWSAKRRLYAYDFMRNEIPGMDEARAWYWRDVGTIQQYFLANMDPSQIVRCLTSTTRAGRFTLWMRPLPPAKFVFDEDGPGGVRHGLRHQLLVSEGCIVSGGHVSERCWGPACASTATQRPPVHPARGRPTSVALPHPPHHHRQERPHSRNTEIGFDPRGRHPTLSK